MKKKERVYSTGLILGILTVFWGVFCGFIGFTLGVIGLVLTLDKRKEYKICWPFILNVVGLGLSIASIVLILIFCVF